MIMKPVMEVDDGFKQVLHGPSGLGEWLNIYVEVQHSINGAGDSCLPTTS